MLGIIRKRTLKKTHNQKNPTHHTTHKTLRTPILNFASPTWWVWCIWPLHLKKDTVKRYREGQQKLSQKGRNCFTKKFKSPETMWFGEKAKRDKIKFYSTTKAMDMVNKGFAFSKYHNTKIRGHLTKLTGDQFNPGKRKHFRKHWWTSGLAATKDYRVDSINRFKMDQIHGWQLHKKKLKSLNRNTPSNMYNITDLGGGRNTEKWTGKVA